MSEFLLFMDELRKSFPFHMEIYYSKMMDWCITVYKKGCAKDYPGCHYVTDDDGHRTEDVLICQEQDIDMQLCFAKAHVAVKEWLLEYEGGY